MSSKWKDTSRDSTAKTPHSNFTASNTYLHHKKLSIYFILLFFLPLEVRKPTGQAAPDNQIFL
eukprot:5968018-Ditylum_brightwellii.AAC.1